MTRAADFWSRRKAAVEAEQAAEEARAHAAREAAERQELESRSDAEILEALDLPDPDTLGPGDDFRAFMAKAVPERLRQKALRRLWLSNPTLANVDGLVDYGQDFTDAAMVVPDLRTVYKVGRGMIDRLAEAAQSEAPAPEVTEIEAGDTTLAIAEAEDTTAQDPAGEEAAPELPETNVVTVEDASAEDEPRPTPRRHMRFAFTE